MKDCMRCMVPGHHDISRRIVAGLFLVVYLLTLSELPAKLLFGNQPMLISIAANIGQPMPNANPD